MRKCIVMIIFLGMSVSAFPQSQEAQQLILNVEKLAQLKSILNNMYNGYKTISKGYNTVKDISKGNYKLHQVFLDGFLKISPAVKNYKKIADIISYQAKIMREQNNAFHYFKETGHFTLTEIQHLNSVYNNLFQQSLKNLDELLLVVTANKLRMSDDERIKAIDGIFIEMQDMLTFLRFFNGNSKVMVAQRSKEQSELDFSKKLNDIK